MENIVGKEALLMLRALLAADAINSPVLEDISEEIDAMEASELMGLIARASRRLKTLRREPGGGEVVLKIDSSYGIFIDGGQEIALRPIPKTIFILFLKHPEGIEFRNLSRYREEMLEIYRTVSPRLDASGFERSIDLLLNPSSNSFRENKSRLTRALESYFEGETLGQCLISGPRTGKKGIALDRAFVEWDYSRNF